MEAFCAHHKDPLSSLPQKGLYATHAVCGWVQDSTYVTFLVLGILSLIQGRGGCPRMVLTLGAGLGVSYMIQGVALSCLPKEKRTETTGVTRLAIYAMGKIDDGNGDTELDSTAKVLLRHTTSPAVKLALGIGALVGYILLGSLAGQGILSPSLYRTTLLVSSLALLSLSIAFLPLYEHFGSQS